MKKIIVSLLCSAACLAAMAQTPTTGPAFKALPPGAHVNADAAVKPASEEHAKPVAAPGPVDPKAGKFQFKEEMHDFKTVPEGPLAECDFEFKNVGKKPIIIAEAHGSCGCTVPSWPKDPILPKHKGVIHVTYNTTGRVGMINKDVIITSNAQQSTMKLHLTGIVKAKPVESKPVLDPGPPPVENK